MANTAADTMPAMDEDFAAMCVDIARRCTKPFNHAETIVLVAVHLSALSILCLQAVMIDHLLNHVDAGLYHIYRHILIGLVRLIDTSGPHDNCVHSELLQERTLGTESYTDSGVPCELLSRSQQLAVLIGEERGHTGKQGSQFELDAKRVHESRDSAPNLPANRLDVHARH